MQRANEQKKIVPFLPMSTASIYSIVTAWFFHVNMTSGGVSEFCFGDWWLFLVVSQFGVELSYLWNQLSPLLWSGSRISADWDRKKYIKSTHFKLYFHWKWQKPLCYNLAEIIRRGFYGIVQNIWAVPSHWFGKKSALQKKRFMWRIQWAQHYFPVQCAATNPIRLIHWTKWKRVCFRPVSKSPILRLSNHFLVDNAFLISGKKHVLQYGFLLSYVHFVY